MEDSSNPLFLHHSYGPGLMLVSQPLNDSNYNIWSRAMLVSLSIKNKTGFIDGSIPKPDGSDPALLNAWTRNNNLGPQYVCTTFSTFVCTNCSGIHREFTHRVKSVSMAKFTPEEVTALQAGGNERAKQIYFKEWDPLRHSYPDSCNIHRLRDFIKQVYVERRFTGERSGGATGNLPRIRLNNKEPYENSTRKSNSLRLEFKSPHSSPGVRSDDTGFRYLYDESKSPRYVQKCSRRGSIGRSPIKFEVVDDRFRDDEYRNRRVTNIGSKLRHLSLDGQKSVEKSQAPVLRPLGEIIGESASSLQVTPSGGEGSVEENPSEQISNNPESFIDLSIKPKAFAAADGVGPETPHMSQASESNWAKFEAPKTPDTNTLSSTTETTPEATFANAIDLLLFELSGPLVPTSGGKSEVPSGDNVPTWDFPSTSMGHTTASPNSTGVSSFTSTTATELTHPSKAAPPQAGPHDAEHFIEVSHAHKPSSIASVSASCSSTTQPTNAPVKAVVSNNQSSVSPNKIDSTRAFTEPFSQTTSKPIQDTRPDVGSQPSRVETKSIGRKELPEDLFTASYLSGPATLAGWQNVQPHAMGYGMQYYPNAVTPSAIPIAPMSTNPFEVTEGRNLIHTSSLPTMASLQGVLPAVSSRTTGLTHASSLGTLEATVPQSTSFASPVPPQSPFASGVPTGVYYNQVNDKQPARPQKVGSFNGNLSGFGSLDTIQQSCGGYGTPKTPDSFFSARGNPFE